MTTNNGAPLRKSARNAGTTRSASSLVTATKDSCMYAYFNGRDWFDEHNRQLDVSRYQLSFRPWCEDYEE